MKRLLITATIGLCLAAVFFFNIDYITSVYAKLAVASNDIRESFSDKKQLMYEKNSLALAYENEKFRSADYIYLRDENRKLRSLLELKEELDISTVSAEVISFGENADYEYFIANKGSIDGVREGNCVISEGGFAGIVEECGDNWCGITTIYSEKLVLSVTCQSNGKTYLLSDMMLNFVSNNDGVDNGDLIVSSGLSEKIPKGLKIAKVDKISPGDGTECKVSVTPVTGYKNMEYILIIS